PVYLTAGNHDVGGWSDTPPSDGTARRDWWRLFGWRKLDAPPPAELIYTQNYSFDYGPVHFVGLEAYDNYDSWRYSIYGAESFTARQMLWLQGDLTDADALYNVLFHHYDFGNELNLSSLGLDMSLWGHIHRDTDDNTPPYDISTDNAGGSNRPFRLVRFFSGEFDPRPTLEAQDGDVLRVTYAPANDGTHDLVTAQVVNGYGERFEYGRLRIHMPADAAGFIVSGGTLAQVDDTGGTALCYVDVDIPANGQATVIVEVDDAAGTPPAVSASRLSAHPNPFNPRTEITFAMPAAGACRLTVFDALGREVAVLADGRRESGPQTVTWDGRDTEGMSLPSGTYFVGLRAGTYVETRKVTLVR
ncbi:metallophosphoesterase, partial [bacterium]|nr:metallophosphoesterase [bacterium]